MKQLSKIKFSLLSALLVLGGCAEHTIEKLEKEPRDEREFNNALANEYESLAKELSRTYGDSVDSQHFAMKGLRATSGVIIMPEDPKNWELSEKNKKSLYPIYDRLLFALDRGRSTEPQLSAKAQVAFDCYTEELEEGRGVPKKFHGQRCKKQAMGYLTQLEQTLFASGPVRRIRFMADSFDLDHDSMMTIEEIAKMLVSYQGKMTVSIVGHTDPIGTDAHNKVLSQSRADAVKNALILKGVNPLSIKSAVGRGELRTSSNESEPHNRAADIYFHEPEMMKMMAQHAAMTKLMPHNTAKMVK